LLDAAAPDGAPGLVLRHVGQWRSVKSKKARLAVWAPPTTRRGSGSDAQPGNRRLDRCFGAGQPPRLGFASEVGVQPGGRLLVEAKIGPVEGNDMLKVPSG